MLKAHISVVDWMHSLTRSSVKPKDSGTVYSRIWYVLEPKVRRLRGTDGRLMVFHQFIHVDIYDSDSPSEVDCRYLTFFVSVKFNIPS